MVVEVIGAATGGVEAAGVGVDAPESSDEGGKVVAVVGRVVVGVVTGGGITFKGLAVLAA
ncbi:MAG: hypothetical protein ACYC5Z_00540 [Acidimicrobiales bacterium]